MKKRERILSLLLAAVMMIGMVALPEPAHAAMGKYIKFSQNGGFFSSSFMAVPLRRSMSGGCRDMQRKAARISPCRCFYIDYSLYQYIFKT